MTDKLHKGFINKHVVASLLDEIRESALQAKTFTNNTTVSERCDYIMDRSYKLADTLGCRSELEEVARRRIY